MAQRSAAAESGSADALPFGADEIDRSLPDRFARVATTWPSSDAIADGSRRLTYAELDRRSDRLAHAIARRAPGRGAPVALLLADAVDTAVGILATWKAAALLVPLDCALPAARLDVVLRDSEARLLVTDRLGAQALDPLGWSSAWQLRLDDLDLDEAVEPPRAVVGPDDLACLLYTSGSTGTPKGVLRTHRTVLHRARCSLASLGITPADRVSGLHSPAFAAGLRDLLAALLGGARFLPFDLRHAGMSALASWIDRERVSVLCAVVTTFRHLLASLDGGRRFPSVRVVRLGSEPLYRQDVERLRERFSPDCLVIAGYGASEASGIVEYRIPPEMSLPAGRVPAGHPHEGVEILILDEAGHPVAAGETGEVAVRSAYLSPGYWRRPDLTRASFTSDTARSESRTYLTGDIGRLAPDGCLEVLGRKDHQVKVRGYLVHPGEVELALAEHPAVHEAVVVGREDSGGNMRLVGYVVPAGPGGCDASALRRFLRGRIPAYMVPAAIVEMPALPVTVNGKVDRAALPPLAAPARPSVVKPPGPLEDQIAALWENLFDVRPVGLRDDFFDLGGDSLLAAAFVAALEDAYGLVVPPSVLLEASTVGDLAALLARQSAGLEPVTVLRDSGALPALFFFHGDYSGGGIYCRALARWLRGNRPLYVVHPHGFDGRGLPPSIEAMAADRFRAVRAMRPRGPYVLGGHCNGGLVALEMARQLRADGQRVDLVVLVEARPPRRALRTLWHAARAWARLRGLTEEERGALFGRLEAGAEAIAIRADYYREQFRALVRSTSGDPLAWTLWRAARKAVRVLGHAPPWRAPAPEAESPARAWPPRAPRAHIHRAIRRYMPTPYDGRTVLFRAEEEPASRPDLGWSAYLPRLEVVVVPGDHITWVTRHAGAFVARLDEVLDTVRPGKE
jgi:amino acid adenylation domain-containing protein